LLALAALPLLAHGRLGSEHQAASTAVAVSLPYLLRALALCDQSDDRATCWVRWRQQKKLARTGHLVRREWHTLAGSAHRHCNYVLTNDFHLLHDVVSMHHDYACTC